MAFHFSEINWLSVVVVTLLTFPLGALWHSKLLFANAWLKDNNLTVEKARAVNPLLVFGGTALFHFAAVLMLDILIGSSATWLQGVLTGAVVSVFAITAIVGTYLFTKRTLRIILIDAGYYLVVFTLSAFVLSIWV